MVTPTIAQSANTRQWIRCRVIAKSARSGEPVLHTVDGCATVRTLALRWSIFYRKKELVTFIFGLIYHFMALSQLQSRGTVPLIAFRKFTGTKNLQLSPNTFESAAIGSHLEEILLRPRRKLCTNANVFEQASSKNVVEPCSIVGAGAAPLCK
jgi:hypothetical protein